MDAAGVRRSNPTANEEVKNDLIQVYKDLGSLSETDWSKVRDLTFNEARAARRSAIDTIATAKCLECPTFVEHVHPLSFGADSSTGDIMKNT